MVEYQKLGFKSGLEIHAQLNTHKLFCNCPSILRQEEPHFKVRRQLRALAGETGQVDIAATYEKTKQLFYIYEGYNDTTCLVELDESPPKEVCKEAFDTALLLAKMMHCKLPSKVQVMRKTVIDGSNTTGFQRTALIGYDGYIVVNKKKIGINYLILEEDAARRTDENKESVTFRLDRLGIPLVEIVTAPDMTTPDEVKDVAEYIGMLVKSTGKAMGGIGSIRQDVNISIKDHCRVELKGVQDLRLMQKYVDAEILRQESSKDDVQHVRNVLPDFTSKFLRPLPGAARMYPETDIPYIDLKETDLEIPELLIYKQGRYEKLVGKELANQLVHSDYYPVFDTFIKDFKNLVPKHIATILLSTSAEVKKKLSLEQFDINIEDIKYILDLQNSGKLALQSTLDIFLEVAKGSKIYNASSKFLKLSKLELKEEIEKLKQQFVNIPEDKRKGIIIGKLRTRADVEDIQSLF